MSIFAIADPHLSFDENVDKPMDAFGKSWENHAERLKKNWIDNVSERDTVIVAGDISWGLKPKEAIADLNWIDALPGRKLIFKGNHDLWWRGITKLNRMFKTLTFMQNKAAYEDGWYIFGTRGWVCPGDSNFITEDRKIYDREIMRLEMSIDDMLKQHTDTTCSGAIPRNIGVLHYPPTNDKFQTSGFTKLFSEVGTSKVVYGHLHGQENFNRGFEGYLNGVEYRLVSMDRVDCKPVKIAD